MRILICAFLLPLLLFAQTRQPPATFPIPKDMQEIWPGPKLTDADKLLLRKAVETDMREFDRVLQEDQRPKFESVDTAGLDLGSLGNGVLVTWSESILCGTGGCPIYAYVHEGNSYRKVLGGSRRMVVSGWAFAVAKSETTIPDLVIASNLNGGTIVLMLYRYSGKTFASESCETLTAKEGAPSGLGRFDPAGVVVSPCGTQAP